VEGAALSLPFPLADAEEALPATLVVVVFFAARDVLAVPVFFGLASACFASSR
jgi:hypothetical protein